MVLFRKGYTFSFVIIILIIVVASAAFYFTHNNSVTSVNLSPDGYHLECVDRCNNSTYLNSSCSIKCELVFGEGPDQCAPNGAVCIAP
ncbi:MAG: hypothetical protein ACP5N7_06085 [Candidatus Pacearchaeota archaeon]